MADFRSGAGRLCLDFMRTLRYRGRADRADRPDGAGEVEELPDVAALCAWVRLLGPVDAERARPGQDREARALREAIHALITLGRDAPEAARETVNAAAGFPVPAPSLEGSGRLRWEAGDPVTATLALVARDALDLVTSPAIERVRRCANPECGVYFLDGSRPGKRRWCSMSTCGNKAKKEALRGRAG